MNFPFRNLRDRVDDFTTSVQAASVNIADGTRALVACALLAAVALCISVVALLR